MIAVSDELNLAALIADRKGTRSYDRLAEDCGGTPSSGRLHQMATRPLKNFPDPDSIRGMANGLGVTVTDIVMAAARSSTCPSIRATIRAHYPSAVPEPFPIRRRRP